MTKVHGNILACLMLALGAVTALGASPLYAAQGDTPETVMQAGKNGQADIATITKEAQAIAARMASDRAFAANLLALAQANDKAGIVKLLKKDAPKSEVTVLTIQDFKLRIRLKTIFGSYDFCFSSDDKACP